MRYSVGSQSSSSSLLILETWDYLAYRRCREFDEDAIVSEYSDKMRKCHVELRQTPAERVNQL